MKPDVVTLSEMNLPRLSVVLLQQRLHGFELREVLTHVGVEDHLDDQVSELAEVALLHVGEDVAVVLLDQPSKVTNMNFNQFYP